MLKKRSSGILTHITTLPSPYGIGDIGPASLAFIDFLVDCGQSCWQFLPTGPTDHVFDNSPYMSSSAFAGSPLLISPELLYQEGYITRSELDNHPHFSPYKSDFPAVRLYKNRLLRQAFTRFRPEACPEYASFLECSPWINDYAIFMTLKETSNNSGWFDWPKEIAQYDHLPLQVVLRENKEEINYFRFEQFEFSRQWRLLRAYASRRNILLIGDLPIYVGYDSVDVWAHQRIFTLNRDTLRPAKVSGVPPDYFSKTGQRWGNPLYDWHCQDPEVQEELLDWWVARLAHLLTQVDITRVDHFRGFESYWAIPEEKATAVDGEWLKGPGINFFRQLEERLGPLPIIAEDLGIITPEVEELRDELGFPGMKVLQFAFDGNAGNSFLPCNFQSPHCVVYTGTHDNETTVGWFLNSSMQDDHRWTIKKNCQQRPA